MKSHLGVFVVSLIASLGLVGRADADPSIFIANLTGAAEVPANNSLGTGFATVTYDPATHLLGIQATFSGLTGTTTAAHIHAPTAVPLTGLASVATTVPTFAGFPLGVTSGTYNNILDMTLASSYNPAFITANGGTTATAEAAFAAALFAGQSYLNIHSTTFRGGEIRGFLVIQPEPASLMAWLAGGLALAAGWTRRRVARSGASAT